LVSGNFPDFYRQIAMKMTTRSLVNSVAMGSVATAALAFGAIDRAQAATFSFSDNFDLENGGAAALGYTSFTNWNVTSADVDLIGNGSFDSFPGNGLYVDLNGNAPGQITSNTTYAFNAGDVVNLSFDLAGAADASNPNVTVALGSLFSQTFTRPQNQAFTPFTTSFTVGSSTNAALTFTAAGGTNGGLRLDNVSLASTGAAPTAEVPEPSDLAGTAFAFGSVVLLKRKFGKKAQISE
jgi:hypothetical protein